LPTLAIRWKV